MEEQPEPQFLDVHALIELSLPRRRIGWIWIAIGAFVLLVLVSASLSSQSREMATMVNAFSAVVMVGLVATMSVVTLIAVRRARLGQLQLEALSELVRLRRWPQAAMLLSGVLSQLPRTPAGRVQALVYLAAVLARS